MLQDVDGYDPIQIVIREIEGLLNIPGNCFYLRKALANMRGHVLAKLQRIVIDARQILVCNVFTQTGADLEYAASGLPRR